MPALGTTTAPGATRQGITICGRELNEIDEPKAADDRRHIHRPEIEVAGHDDAITSI